MFEKDLWVRKITRYTFEKSMSVCLSIRENSARTLPYFEADYMSEASQTWGGGVHDTSKALFSSRKMGHLLRIERAFLRLLQHLGDKFPQCPSASVYKRNHRKSSQRSFRRQNTAKPTDH